MGSLTDPILRAFHQSIQEALYWSSKPDFQRVCEILNRMNMDDMLDEIWRISVTGMLDSLAGYIPRATNVNIARLRAAVGAQQTEAPGDFDALLRSLPPDQQRSIKNVRAVTQAPKPLSPTLWSKYYWSVRSVPPPDDDDDDDDGDDGDNDEAHLAADIASAITANAPKGSSPITYTVTVVFRNLDAVKLGKGPTELAFLHEPNVSVQISPDPNSKAAYQAAISLINLHVKRRWGLIKPDIEFSISGQGTVTNPGGTPSGGAQSQIEIHVTTTISVTLTSGITFGPPSKPGGPPDYGGIHGGNSRVDIGWTPFMIGILGHWDPPTGGR